MQDTPQITRAASRRIVLLCGLASATLTVLFAVYRPAFLAQMDDRVYDALVRCDSAPASPAERQDRHRRRRRAQPGGDRPVAVASRSDRAARHPRSRAGGRGGRAGRHLRRAGSIRRVRRRRQAGESAPDAALAGALAGGRVMLGYAFTFDPSQSFGADCVLHPVSLPILHPRGSAVESPIFHATGAICSLPPLARAAGSSGFLNAVPDADGTLRRVPVLIEFQGRVYPSLALAAMMAAGDSHAIALRSANVNASALILNSAEVPLDGRSNLLLRYRGGNRSFRHVSAADVIQGQTPPATLHQRHRLRGRDGAGHARDRRDAAHQPVHRRRGAGDGRRQPAAAGLRVAAGGCPDPGDADDPDRRHRGDAGHRALRARRRQCVGHCVVLGCSLGRSAAPALVERRIPFAAVPVDRSRRLACGRDDRQAHRTSAAAPIARTPKRISRSG